MNSVLIVILCALYFLAPTETYAKCNLRKSNKKRCIKIQECEPITTRLKELVSTKSNELDSFRQEVEKLKCGDNTDNPRNFKVLCPVKRSSKQNPIKPIKPIKCGEMALSRDLPSDGPTKPDRYEWLALLEYKTPKGIKVLCSGVLISDRHVLTAASCLDKDYQATSVRLREFNLATKTDSYFGERLPQYESIDIVDEKKHENYSFFGKQIKPDLADIAILKLARPVSTQPICLPTRDAQSDRKFDAVGWGTSLYNSKKKPRFSVKSLVQMLDTVCHESRNENTICVNPMSFRTKDACVSDVGGPLMQIESRKNHINEPYVVSGIYAPNTREHCKAKDFTYTNVFKYLDWIHENMN